MSVVSFKSAVNENNMANVFNRSTTNADMVARILDRAISTYKANQVGHVFNGPQGTSFKAGLGQVLSPNLYTAYKAYQGLGDAKRWYHAPLMVLAPKHFAAFQLRKQLGNEGVGSGLAAFFAPDLATISSAKKLRKLDVLG
jgi:hypothetical protein